MGLINEHREVGSFLLGPNGMLLILLFFSIYQCLDVLPPNGN